MLEGTSVGLGEAALREASSGSGEDPAREPAPRSAEPRPEIWFRRRVGLFSAVRELWAFRELVLTLAERDLRVRYKQAALGLAWALFTPVMTMIAFTLIFTKVTHVNTHFPAVPYALFSYMGLLPWTFFSTSLSQGGLSLVGNVALLNKLYCPREVFPIATMIDAAFDALVACLVLVLLFPILGFAPRVEAFYIPILLIPLVAFTLGVTLFVSVVVVYLRDLRLVLPMIVQLGLFATPVIYSTANMSQGVLIGYSVLNPLVPVLEGLRRTVLLGEAPNWASLAAGTASSLVILSVGFLLFKRMETGIADVA